jgi:hypothetical protein
MKKFILILLLLLVSFFTASNNLPTRAEPSSGVILLTFDGYTSPKPLWDNYCSFAPADLDLQRKQVIQAHLAELFANYAVIITTSDSLFYSSNPRYRVRCVITSTPLTSLTTYYGIFLVQTPIGGRARINSLANGDSTAAVVSTDDVDTNPRYIAEMAAHEIGHALGLWHKSVWKDGQIVQTYDPGTFTFAPIMGYSLAALNCGWTTGLDQRGLWINDDSVISQTFHRLTPYEIELQKSKYFNKP